MIEQAAAFLARLVELGGAVVIAWTMFRAFAGAAPWTRSEDVAERMRLTLAKGVVTALGLMTAGALLKTIGLRSWHAIGVFAVTFALRTLVKRALAAELRFQEERLRASRCGCRGGRPSVLPRA